MCSVKLVQKPDLHVPVSQVVYTDGDLPQINLLLPTDLNNIPSVRWHPRQQTPLLVEIYNDNLRALDDHRRLTENVNIESAPYHWAKEDLKCAHCGKTSGLKCCSRCRLSHYCSQSCQHQAYPGHKKACKKACKHLAASEN